MGILYEIMKMDHPFLGNLYKIFGLYMTFNGANFKNSFKEFKGPN